MKKLVSLFFVIVFAFGSNAFVYAAPQPEKTDIVKSLLARPQEKIISNEELFMSVVDVAAEGEGIPSTYQFIALTTDKLQKGTRLYRAYQKAVYLDLIPNNGILLDLSGVATERKLVQLIQQMYGKKVNGEILVNGHKFDIVEKKIMRNKDLVAYAQGYLEASGNDDNNTAPAIESAPNFVILNDVYTRLLTEHADKANFDSKKLLEGAMMGMTEATGDKYTTYFPPEKAKEFTQDLNGDFEGIGAYVEMPQPGIVMVTSPLVGSPAEAAGIKGGDRIKKIDGVEITKDMTLQDATAKIKGPAGTKVTIIIERNSNDLTFEIERKKIHVDLVNYKKIDQNTSYIQVTSYGAGVSDAFSGAVSKVVADNTSKLILDLRNNPGGDVDEVANMLNFFVPKGMSKVNVVGNGVNEPFLSTGNTDALKNVKIVILINSGTASAAEIMAGTIKDYLSDQTRLVGEKSYGKGSVQSYIPYGDGSSVKYTTAKWYTGKTSIGINHIGIKPDVEVILDQTAFKQGTDNQLNAAQSLNF